MVVLLDNAQRLDYLPVAQEHTSVSWLLASAALMAPFAWRLIVTAWQRGYSRSPCYMPLAVSLAAEDNCFGGDLDIEVGAVGRPVQRAGSTSTTAGYAGNEDPSTIKADAADISCSHGGDGVKTRCSTRPRERLEKESITRLSLRMFSFAAGLRCLRKVSDLCVLSVTPWCLCIRLEDGDPTGRSIIHTWDSANCFI